MTEPGWYNDERDPTRARWWDGARWTDHTMVKADWTGPGAPPPPGQPQPAFTPSPPPAPPVAQPHRPSPDPAVKKRGCLWWVGLGVVAIVVISVIAALAGGGDDTKDRQEEREASINDDVQNVECVRRSAGGFMLARVTVLNNSADRSNYIIDVSFESPDGGQQYATGTALLNGLNPGQTSVADANSLTEPTVPDITCRVQEVTRFSDE